MVHQRSGLRRAVHLAEPRHPVPHPRLGGCGAAVNRQFGADQQRSAALLPAVVPAAEPAALLHAVGADVPALAGQKYDVGCAGPVLQPAFQQLPFEEQGGLDARVGHGELLDLRSVRQFRDGEVPGLAAPRPVTAGAAVHTEKTVSGPACVPAPTWSCGIFMRSPNLSERL